MIRLALVLALALLVGCSGKEVRPIESSTPKVALPCSAMCTTPCVVDPKDWPQWTADASKPQAWKELGEQVVGAFNAMVKRCDLQNRCACVRCLASGQDAGLYLGQFDVEAAGCNPDDPRVD